MESVGILTFLDFYSGKKILITGHTGFKGSWLAAILKNSGAEVFGYSLKEPSSPSLYSILNISKSIHERIADIRDLAELKKYISEVQPEVIFHFAAQPLVSLSYEDPIGTLNTNIMGTAHVLDASRGINSIRSIVVITSDKCYENVESDTYFIESDPMGGLDPYSASKGAAELVVNSMRHSFFNTKDFGKTHSTIIVSARAGNVIGGGDWAKDRVIPDSIRSLCAKSVIEIRNPDSIRPWQHVLDPLFGYLRLGALTVIQGVELSGAWNFGPAIGDTKTVKALVEQVLEIWGEGDWIQTRQSFHEAGFLKLSSEKAYTTLGWTPIMNSSEAIQQTICWYHEWFNGKTDMIEYTNKSIEKYILRLRES